MFHVLSKYLFLYKKAEIPGIGVFKLKRQAATHDFIHKIFLAPVINISFDPKNTTEENQHFHLFVGKELHVDKNEAIKICNEFAVNLRTNLTVAKEADLPGIGKLLKSETGLVSFRPTLLMHEFFLDVAAERVGGQISQIQKVPEDRSLIRTDNKILKVKKVAQASVDDGNWWIYAIALTIVGVSALIYYYLQNGSLQ